MAKIVRKQRTATEDLPNDWQEFCTRVLLFASGLALGAIAVVVWGADVLSRSPYCGH